MTNFLALPKLFRIGDRSSPCDPTFHSPFRTFGSSIKNASWRLATRNNRVCFLLEYILPMFGFLPPFLTNFSLRFWILEILSTSKLTDVTWVLERFEKRSPFYMILSENTLLPTWEFLPTLEILPTLFQNSRMGNDYLAPKNWYFLSTLFSRISLTITL